MIILIPSLEPTPALAELVDSLQSELPDAHILIIDDGSGPTYQHVFRALEGRNVTVIGYEVNRGKGFALRTGFHWCMKNAPDEVVVCADSDGQHRPADIAKVANMAHAWPDATVLGVRAFQGEVPLRSRFGNSASALFFRLATGVKIDDTQTGLRAFGSRQLSKLMEVPGDRFEWELNALLVAADSGQDIIQVPIDTVYEDGNSGSHFRPITDSIRVFWPLVSFAVVGIGSWALEMFVFVMLSSVMGLSGPIGLSFSVVMARILSGSVNFLANKHKVFHDTSSYRTKRQILEYSVLAVALLSITILGVEILTWIGLTAWLAKAILDVCCFGVSFIVQRRLIFSRDQSLDEPPITVPLTTGHVDSGP
ncbi:bifunctional glycosyltransferase family 2/GtrA family protein [Actinomycetaceae bacterium MB13-C1-2]|nr:bifunctional glycosyltransferase family 2/GtrA family protein [Actinomycetaceae bacterium MB13-C1-2]